jgi:tripartite-type tricarboxylate transporter receptor subunit TctC
MNATRNLAGAFAALALLTAAPVGAQDFPSKTIEIVVPYPPGGSTDVVARKLQQKLSEMWGKPVMVDNRAGGNGNIGTAYVARSPADGHRLLMSTSALLTVNPHVHTNPGFDAFKDFAPVSLVSNGALAVGVNPSLGINTLADLVAYVKRNPKKVFYATPSSGTPQHLVGELLNQVAGLDMTPVHYKGIAPALNDVLAGNVPLVFSTYAALKPQADAGRIKVLAVAEPKRMEMAPSVPTMSETFPGFEMTTWFGIFAPAGTPPAVVNRLSQAIATIIAQPDVNQLLNSLALPPMGSGPQEMGRVLRMDFDRLGKVVRDNKITAD